MQQSLARNHLPGRCCRGSLYRPPDFEVDRAKTPAEAGKEDKVSCEVIFSFSVSISKPMRIPVGTIYEIEDRIKKTETALRFTREKYLKNPERWVSHDIGKDVDDKTACRVVSEHNQYSFWLWWWLSEWANKTPDGNTEILTVEKSAELFPFLGQLSLSPDRWTGDFYQEQMVELYEVMRGRETNGISFDVKALTPAQADAVINFFSRHLDTRDIRLAVPKGHDYLARSDDGGYSWCDKCYCAIVEQDVGNCRKRKCPLVEDGEQ